MPNSVITNAGLALLARAQAEGFAVSIDRMIFADIPGLDPEATPSPATVMPAAEFIVSDGAIERAGRANDDTVVYSRILSANDGPYYLNWIGLYSTEHETLVAVSVVYRHYKYATDGFRAGLTLYKNFAIQYANAAALTGIEIDAAAWQFDFDARYEPLGAVADHNGDAAPHPNKFEASGAVNTHNTAATAHQTLFNNKANKNFDNLDLPAALANLGFLQAATASGYVKLPGGLIVQWGIGTERYCGSGGSNEVYTDNFSINFPTACLFIQTGLYSPAAADKTKLTNCTTVAVSWTASNFTWGLDQVHDAVAVNANVSYLAIGY